MMEQPTTDNRQPTTFLKSVFVLLLVVSCLLFVSNAHAQSVDLLWQGDTYTPPFYQGRSLWSTQSRIVFVAIPHGLGNAASLNYKWIKNGTVLGSLSGTGKNSLPFIGSIISKPQTIAVEIVREDIDGEEVLARKTLVVNPIESTVAVYENNPLYGFMLHQAVGNEYRLKEREVTYTAFPYFFSANNRSPSNLNYEWRTNTGGLETRGSVTYRIPENTSGSSQVSLRVNNKTQITQDVRKGFLVEFGQ